MRLQFASFAENDMPSAVFPIHSGRLWINHEGMMIELMRTSGA